MASTYINRTVTSTGNQRTFTISYWYKRSEIGLNNHYIFSYGTEGVANDPRSYTGAKADDRFAIGFNPTGSQWYEKYSVSYHRDVNAWYHCVWSVDTTQATEADRVKLYVNGSQVSLTGDTISQNFDTGTNTTKMHEIGSYPAGRGNGYLDGYLAHFNFCDGTAYDASYFGETDANGVWKPKTSPSVTYGTNGFFLKFENSGSMGTDSSGNGNNFTGSGGNLTQTLDTPSNVFATMNPLHSASTTFSNGNTKVVGASSGNPISTSTLAVSKGKWYWETKMKGSYFNVGIMRVDQNILTSGIGYGSAGWVYAIDGNIYHNGSALLQTGTTISANDIVGFYLDLDNGTLKLQKNGSNVYSGNAVITSIPLTDFYYIETNSLDFDNEFNFGNGYFGSTAVSTSNSDAGGQGIFEYSPTLSGVNYYALNTKNLATYG